MPKNVHNFTFDQHMWGSDPFLLVIWSHWSTDLQSCLSARRVISTAESKYGGNASKKCMNISLCCSSGSIRTPSLLHLSLFFSLQAVCSTVFVLLSLFLYLFASKFVCISLSARALYVLGCMNLSFFFFSPPLLLTRTTYVSVFIPSSPLHFPSIWLFSKIKGECSL